jgi:predicted Na+-dependent transporter
VLAPLAAGLLLRGLRPRLRDASGALNGTAALVVCALLYAAISGIHGGRQIVDGIVGSAAFIVVSAAIGVAVSSLWRGSGLDSSAVIFTTGLRDFAVAAALAAQAFGTGAASVAGVYGALMLLAGAIAATLVRRRSAAKLPHERGSPLTDA